MRVALVSVHTSPYAQPGAGDAGGMNVYVRELAARLPNGDDAVEVDVVTRETLRLFDPRRYDVVHSHYWRSGLLARHSGVPWVHSMHTMGAVKQLDRALGAEPPERIAAERAIVGSADRLIANTEVERDQLVEHYAADRARIHVVHPGVDVGVFRPGRAQARRRLGLDPDRPLLVFAGRIQPLKAPDVVLRAARGLAADVVVIGSRSGDEAYELSGLHPRARFVAALPQAELACWLAAATLVCVPSRSESFGLVALEAQACGTPVVAARVGGLPTAVADAVTGLLVDGHDPERWTAAIASLMDDPAARREMGRKAVVHAESFGWDATVERTVRVYRAAVENAR